MAQPGEQRPPDSAAPSPARAGDDGVVGRLRPRSMGVALVQAALVAVLAALAWALLKGILELGIGLLAVAAFGGWLIGAILFQVRAAPLWAALIAGLAWLGGLVGTWLVSMAILPASSRTFLERLEGTPFLDWLSPQFGLLEMAGLVVFVVAGLYGARPRS